MRIDLSALAFVAVVAHSARLSPFMILHSPSIILANGTGPAIGDSREDTHASL